MYEKDFLNGSLNPFNIVGCQVFNYKFRKEHPTYFDPDGLLLFCGGQGSGKTLSAVQYVKKLLVKYPEAILCTNVDIFDLPEGVKKVEYEGLDSLKFIENGYEGVIYLIDEIHLEANSLESKNIDVEIMVEVSQQRKQRKHIVCTSQVYGRLAKPFREQVKNVVLCRNFFRFIQYNKLIDGTKTREENGKLITETFKSFIWFHSPALYSCYDTYAKMKRYKKEWKGRRLSGVERS